MSNTTQSLYEQRIQSTAQELLASGYKVSIEPLISDLPFELGGYRPNLIATKDTEGIVLEIQTTLNRLSVDRFQDISERVATHQGILMPIDPEMLRLANSSIQILVKAWSEENY